MKKRLLSMLLTLVMLLGMIPVMTAAPVLAADKAEDIVIDFEGLAAELADQEWWTGEYIGNRTTNGEITEAQTTQYSALLNYLAENKDWTINETQSKFNYPSYWNKRLIIDAADEYPWATCLYTGYINVPASVGQDGFQIDLDVTAEQAGEYVFNLEAYAEDISGTPVVSDMYAGSGFVKVQVNGETALDSVSTTDANTMKTFQGTIVNLQAGTNTIVIRCTGDISGGNQGGRRNIYVNKLTFEPYVDPDAPIDRFEIDLLELAQELPEQDWWQDLDIGVASTTGAMTEEAIAQYDALREYLAENKYWNINENASYFKAPLYYAKVFRFNTSMSNTAGQPWATRLYATYTGVDAQDFMQYDLTVPAGQGGEFVLYLDAFMEKLNGAAADVDGRWRGGGYIKVDVNGETVLDDTSTQGENIVSSLNCGRVILKDGINTIRIHCAGDAWNQNQSSYRNIYLNNIAFERVYEEEENLGHTLKIDFNEMAEEIGGRQWWQNLPLGTRYTTETVSDEQKAQYAALIDYLGRNKNWTFNETGSKFNSPSYWAKRMNIDTAGVYDWATCMYSSYMGVPGQDSYQVDLTVTAAQAGEYQFSAEIFRQNEADTQYPADMYAGSGTLQIEVNGTVVLESTITKGDNVVEILEGTTVELTEGANAVVVRCMGDVAGTKNAARRNIYVNSLIFEPVEINHANTASETVSNNDRTHTTTVTCLDCGEIVSEETTDCNDGDGDGLCDACDYELVCRHTNTKIVYIDNEDGTHDKKTACLKCEEFIASVTETCSDEDEDGYCVCGAVVEAGCDHTNTTESVVDNGDKTHTITVTCECGEVISTEIVDCADDDKDTKCDACGAALVTITKFSMAGSNMTLGNELVVNVMFMKNKITGEGNTIEITHGDAVTTIAQENWESYNAAMYVARIPVAAKEMADDLTVTVKNADGYEIATAYTTSVREYAGKVLAGSINTYSQLMKNLAVDMLNYGAAAQTNFSYNTEDMANKLLTEEQAGWATADVTCANNQVKGTKCMGSNLSLESKILLNIIFQLTETAAADKYAMVTYTDYTGKAVEYRVDAFNRFNASMQGVVIDEIVLADAFQLVTVTVYNADGTVYGTGSDSVESYAARTSNDLNAAIMKFASSAKTYLSK